MRFAQDPHVNAHKSLWQILSVLNEVGASIYGALGMFKSLGCRV